MIMKIVLKVYFSTKVQFSHSYIDNWSSPSGFSQPCLFLSLLKGKIIE